MTSRILFNVLLLVLYLLGTSNSVHAAPSEEKQILLDKYHEIYAIQNGYDKADVKLNLNVKCNKFDIERNISEQKRNVICGLKYIALSYMRISKNLFLWYDKDQLDSAVGQIESFNEHALNMITVLYNIGYQDTMFSMWYFYIYSCKIGHFRARIDINKQNDAKLTTIELADIHENVIEKLSQHIKVCKDTKHNIASTSHTLNEKYKYLSTGNANHKEIIAVIDAYKGSVSDLINYNKKLQYGSNNASRLTIDSLYLNGVVLNEEIMNELLNFYDSNIDWGDAADVLKNTYNNLFDSPSIMFDNFREIHRFQMLFKNLLLTIVFRFAWIHLVISDKYYNKPTDIMDMFLLNTVNHENNEFRIILEPFLQFLDLHNHPGLNDLLYCLKERPSSCLKNGEGVAIIVRELTVIGIHFNNFDPMDGIISNEQDIEVHFEKMISFARRKRLLTQYRSKPIKEHSNFKKNHTRLFIFINRVRQILYNADFELMNMLLSYTTFTTLDKLKSNNDYKNEILKNTTKIDLAETKVIPSIEKIDETTETVLNIRKENDINILFERFKIMRKQAEDQPQSKPDKLKSNDEYKYEVSEDKSKNDGAKLIEDKIKETTETVFNIGDENDINILLERFKIMRKQAEDQPQSKPDNSKTDGAEDNKKPAESDANDTIEWRNPLDIDYLFEKFKSQIQSIQAEGQSECKSDDNKTGVAEDKIKETIETVSNIGEKNDKDDILFEKFKIKKKQAEDQSQSKPDNSKTDGAEDIKKPAESDANDTIEWCNPLDIDYLFEKFKSQIQSIQAEGQSEGKSDDNKTGVAEDKKKLECGPSTYGPNEDDDTNIPSSVWHPQKDGPNLLRTWIELNDKNDILSSIFGTTAYKNDSDKSSEAEELQQDNVKEKQIGEEEQEDKKAEPELAPEEVQAPTLQPRSLEYENYPDELDLANLSGGVWEIPGYLFALSEYNAIVDESPSEAE